MYRKAADARHREEVLVRLDQLGIDPVTTGMQRHVYYSWTPAQRNVLKYHLYPDRVGDTDYMDAATGAPGHTPPGWFMEPEADDVEWGAGTGLDTGH